MTVSISVLATVLAVVISGEPQAPAASQNRCAVCHLRLAWTQSVITHVDQWVTSQHAWARVGCETCHGGDARTSDQRGAHRGVMNSADPSSPVNRVALPATCGRCHAAEASAFARSAHHRLLADREPAAPTCTSCHRSMAADVPSATELERECRNCHHADDRAVVARRAVDEAARLRRRLNRVKWEIAGVMDSERRTTLTAQWTAADAALRSVVASLHSFDLSQVEERLGETNVQTQRLADELRRP